MSSGQQYAAEKLIHLINIIIYLNKIKIISEPASASPFRNYTQLL